MGADYRKLTINYLILGNGGGLAALVALYPLIKETNPVWLTHQLPVTTSKRKSGRLHSMPSVILRPFL
jgi:hypothetical protein